MLLIYLPDITTRCEYIFELILGQHLGLQYRITKNLDEFEIYLEEKINYSGRRFSAEFFIKSSGFLQDDSIKKFTPEISTVQSMTVLFPGSDSDTGFDIFSAAFYMVSRYEEYLPYTPDEWGRFNHTESFAYKNNFLQKPVVDLWIQHLKYQLHKKYPSLHFSNSKFNAILTYDIDVAFKYKGRNFMRTSGAIVKSLINLDFKNTLERLKTLAGSAEDPWDIYDSLREKIKTKNIQSIFFFLVGKKSMYDRNLHPGHHMMKKLVHKIKGFGEAGLHPSYYSSTRPEKFLEEKEKLEKISGHSIFKSRQHFLKFNLPDTYLQLQTIGIREDYSMGFANNSGFRAGTSQPFYFYDVKNEEVTNVKVFPITYMEGSYLESHTPIEAQEKMLELLKEVKNVNGTFISIWHNHTLSDDYAEWKEVHDVMLEKIWEEIL